MTKRSVDLSSLAVRVLHTIKKRVCGAPECVARGPVGSASKGTDMWSNGADCAPEVSALTRAHADPEQVGCSGSKQATRGTTKRGGELQNGSSMECSRAVGP